MIIIAQDECDSKVLVLMRSKEIPMPDQDFWYLHETARDIAFHCIVRMQCARRHIVKTLCSSNDISEKLYERYIMITYAINKLTEFVRGEYVVERNFYTLIDRHKMMCDMMLRISWYASRCAGTNKFVYSRDFTKCTRLLHTDIEYTREKFSHPMTYDDEIVCRYEELFPHDAIHFYKKKPSRKSAKAKDGKKQEYKSRE